MSTEVPGDTAYLGAFDPLEAPLVIELLAEHRIMAFSKTPLDQAEAAPYGTVFGDTGRGRLFVETKHLDEARKIVTERLPERIAEMQRALEEGFASEEILGDPEHPIGEL